MKKEINKSDVMQNMELHRTTGAFKTAPLVGVQNEAGILSY